MQLIITSPSLDPSINVSGVSAVTQFIIENNTEQEYVHFELGRKDGERGGVFRIKAILVALAAWVKLLKKYPHAIIHYNFPLEKPSILRDPMFMQIARWMGRKMVVHIHGGVFLTSPKIPFPFRQILQYVLGWNVPFIVLSESEKKIIQERFGVKQVVPLPNCVDLRDASLCKREYSNREKPIVLGYLGRITETKGVEYILEACCILKERGIPFTLRIAGVEDVEGHYLPKFTEQLGSQFEYMGLVSGEKKNLFLRSLDVFVMPTFFEGLPMSLLECMSYGVVPIVTPVGSIPEVVEDGINGCLIKVRDTQSIVDTVTLLQNDSDRLEQISQTARETIFCRFNPQEYVSTLNKTYDQL